MRPYYLVLAMLACAAACGAEPDSLDRLASDARTVLVQRKGLHTVIRYLESRHDLFSEERNGQTLLLRREEKDDVRRTWQRFLDYLVSLEGIERCHAGFYRREAGTMEDSFFIGYAAMLARYRAALEFIERVEGNPEVGKVLNDSAAEIGLPAGTYAAVKFKYLNVVIATEFAAREALATTFSGQRQLTLREAIQADAYYIWATGRSRGPALTAANGLKILSRGAQAAWLPIQAGVAEWMGDTKVYRTGRSLVSPAQIQQLQPKLRPGDILLTRREWYLSNVGSPGFWSHAALYLGTAEERRAC